MNTLLIFISFFLLYLLLIKKAGDTYPIMYLFLFTYFLQYIFSTYLIYTEYDVLRRQMVIGQYEYFDYAVKALLFLFAGAFIFNKDISISGLLTKINPIEASRLGYLLLVISYSFDFLQAMGFTSISSILSFTTYLKYVAAFCLLFTYSWFNYLLIAIAYTQLGLAVLQGGVFIDFFVWCTYLFFFIALKFRLSFLLRTSFIIIAAPTLILIQTVKDEYRKATWVKQNEAGIELFADLAVTNSSRDLNAPYTQSTGIIKTVSRLTQGWHLGLTLKHVPKKEPFTNGDEIISDISSSLLARLILPDKKIVGSQGKFYKYTGYKLRGNTSMTIGMLGDFYINFGRWGSFVALFLFGALIARLLYYFYKKYVLPDPINIIWIPFLLSYLIRANNDFYMVFNSLVKGFLIFLVINFIRKKLWLPKRIHNLQ